MASESEICEAIDPPSDAPAAAGTPASGKRKATSSNSGSSKRMTWDKDIGAQLDLLELVLELQPHLKGHGKVQSTWNELTQRMQQVHPAATARGCQDQFEKLMKEYKKRTAEEEGETGSPQNKSSEERKWDALLAELVKLARDLESHKAAKKNEELLVDRKTKQDGARR